MCGASCMLTFFWAILWINFVNSNRENICLRFIIFSNLQTRHLNQNSWGIAQRSCFLFLLKYFPSSHSFCSTGCGWYFRQDFCYYSRIHPTALTNKMLKFCQKILVCKTDNTQFFIMTDIFENVWTK